MSELKPCPFCGADRASTYHISDGRVAMCPACGAKGGSQFNGPLDIPSANDRAILAWNARADLPPTLSAALVDRIEELNAACDAMWNDQGRVVKCDNIIMGTPYAIKEKHMRAISEAQQRLFTALAAIKEPKT